MTIRITTDRVQREARKALEAQGIEFGSEEYRNNIDAAKGAAKEMLMSMNREIHGVRRTEQTRNGATSTGQATGGNSCGCGGCGGHDLQVSPTDINWAWELPPEYDAIPTGSSSSRIMFNGQTYFFNGPHTDEFGRTYAQWMANGGDCKPIVQYNYNDNPENRRRQRELEAKYREQLFGKDSEEYKTYIEGLPTNTVVEENKAAMYRNVSNALSGLGMDSQTINSIADTLAADDDGGSDTDTPGRASTPGRAITSTTAFWNTNPPVSTTNTTTAQTATGGGTGLLIAAAAVIGALLLAVKK